MNLERSLKNQITESVTKTLLAGVFDQSRGFARICVRAVIEYLFVEYGQVEYQDLVGKGYKLADPWDANRPFQELIQ